MSGSVVEIPEAARLTYPADLLWAEQIRLPHRVARGAGIVHDRGWLVRRALVAADALAILLAFAIATAATAGVDLLADSLFWQQLTFLMLGLPIWVVAAKVCGLYDRDGRHAHYSSVDDIVPVFNIATLAAFMSIPAWHALGAEPDWSLVFIWWLAVVALVPVVRACARTFSRSRVEFLQNTVVVGAGDVGQAIARKFLQHPEAGINVVGFVDANPRERDEDLRHVALLGSLEELPELIALLDVERVVIAFSADDHHEVLQLIRRLRDLQVHIDIVPRLFDLIGPGVDMHSIEGMPLIGLSTLSLSRSSQIVKRSLDVVVSTIALLVLAPLFAVVALLIKLDTPGPVLFVQTRMGEGNRPFGVLKFRTMVIDAEAQKEALRHLNVHRGRNGDDRMFKVRNDPRVTRTGRFLRAYFLDELPQLVNVLRGEMSLIGPRPLILDEARFVDDWGRRRLELKPGMTGSWQVLGRSAIAFDEMVKLDYLYVTTWSLGSDLRLLLRTVPLVLRGEPPV
jgi:exopolysaccharide biosynthesis polyprenyl glycosylphosphotransferase